LFFYKKSNSWRLTLAKLYALRVLCYPNIARKMELEYYISYVWEKHDVDMQQETNMDDKISYSSLRTLHLPQSQIQFLIYGDESYSPNFQWALNYLAGNISRFWGNF